MTVAPLTVLAAGATRSIGRLVVAEALRQGNDVRVLVRSADKARGLSKGVPSANMPTSADPAIPVVQHRPMRAGKSIRWRFGRAGTNC